MLSRTISGFLVIILLSVNVSAQTGCDTIFWSASRKLVPNDFKDVADTGKTMIAFTMAKFGYKVFPQSDEMIVNTSTYFLPCRSWLNRRNMTNSLNHEQLHFDIAEYYRRLFLQRINETTYSADLFPSATRAIFRDLADQRRQMDDNYDKQTNVGLNAEEQKKWIDKVASLLSGLKKYETTISDIKLK